MTCIGRNKSPLFKLVKPKIVVFVGVYIYIYIHTHTHTHTHTHVGTKITGN